MEHSGVHPASCDRRERTVGEEEWQRGRVDGMSALQMDYASISVQRQSVVCVWGGCTCWMQMVLNCCLCFPSGVKPSLPYVGGGGGTDVLGK